MPTEERSQAFQEIIQEVGIPSTIRQRRGIDVAAGCGQLKAQRVKRAGGKSGINVPMGGS
jgi:23S rRNA (adenine2503-C2)-methyltransferase